MVSQYAETVWPGVTRFPKVLSWVGRLTNKMSDPLIYSEASDAALIAASSGGDRRAFDEIVLRHGPFALRVAARLVPDQAIAEDIVQEAMVRAWAQARHFDPQRARLTTWLYRIVVNLCIDYRRRRQHEQIPDDFDAADPAAGAEDSVRARGGILLTAAV